MKQTIFYLLLLIVVLASCKGNKEQKIIGKWHAVHLENPEMDSFFINSQKYIDTIGKGNDDETNLMLYGVTNMDSLRHIMQSQYDSAVTMQLEAVTNTVFDFRADSVAILSFAGNVDSGKWYFEKEGILVLEEMSGDNAGEKVTMEIVSISDTALKLKFEENDAISTVTFHPEGK